MSEPFKDHFSGHARDYAEHRPRYPAALAAVLAERAGGRALALDCGCGSGQLSILLAEHFQRVVATDPSAAQIANAAPHPRVSYAVAPAERAGLGERSADLVAAAQAAHWFDLPAFWREVDRVARPGALVALVGYSPMRLGETIDAPLRHFHDIVLKDHWPPERWSVVRGYVDIAFPYPELSAPALEMTADWSLTQLLRYLETWSAVKAAERTTGRSPLPELASELARRWGGPPEERRRICWPLFLRLGRVGDARR